MLQLDNITTADDYELANTISDQQSDLLAIGCANADVYAQFRPYDPERQNELPWGDEVRIVAPAHQIIEGVAGVRVRSATSGDPATVTAQLYEPSDIRPSSAAGFVQVVTTLGQLGFQHNGVLQATEANVDLEDSVSLDWTLTNDPANTRMKVSGTVIGAPPTGAAAGDLAGAYPNPTVDGLQGRSVAATAPSTNQALVWNGSSWTPVTVTAAGTAGGDLAGSYPNPTVDGLQGRAVAATPPSTNQGLVWNGSSWTPASLVNSFNGRQGAVAPASGDYTAAMVTSAADKSSSSDQVFTGRLRTPLTFEGMQLVSLGLGGTTLTPDLSQASYWIGQVTAGTGTITVALPTNIAPAGFYNQFWIELQNTGASGSHPITWAANYAWSAIAKPVTLAPSTTILILFVEPQGSGVFYAVAAF